MPYTTNFGATFCCSQFANWMATENEYHKSGLAWHNDGCLGFLPKVTYGFAEQTTMELRATSPDDACVLLLNNAYEVVTLAWGIPYHHATRFVESLRWAKRGQVRATVAHRQEVRDQEMATLTSN